VTRGTANVFADLGFPDAAERQAKPRLAYALNQVLAARQLSPVVATEVLGVAQPGGEALDATKGRAASAAVEVGYESPSQFSREYARLFGAPPKRDVVSTRAKVASTKRSST
jgi:AraC-like DNA-binding protein